MAIDESVFSDTDLNLMVTFLVLYRERSLTKAASYLNVGQPAVSCSLAKLRKKLDDELFLRTKYGVVPTERAVSIATFLEPAMERIQALLAHQL